MLVNTSHLPAVRIAMLGTFAKTVKQQNGARLELTLPRKQRRCVIRATFQSSKELNATNVILNVVHFSNTARNALKNVLLELQQMKLLGSVFLAMESPSLIWSLVPLHALKRARVATESE
jgi:hypothetical protein